MVVVLLLMVLLMVMVLLLMVVMVVAVVLGTEPQALCSTTELHSQPISLPIVKCLFFTYTFPTRGSILVLCSFCLVSNFTKLTHRHKIYLMRK